VRRDPDLQPRIRAWCVRDAEERAGLGRRRGELVDKRVALINASTRATHAYAALKETLTTMSGQVVEEAGVTIPLHGSTCDADSIAADAHLPELLRVALAALARAARAGGLARVTPGSNRPEYFRLVRVFVTARRTSCSDETC
jgi:hypothetical protein